MDNQVRDGKAVWSVQENNKVELHQNWNRSKKGFDERLSPQCLMMQFGGFFLYREGSYNSVCNQKDKMQNNKIRVQVTGFNKVF